MRGTVQLTEEQQRALDGFRLHLEADGKAARTVESYCGDVGKFLAHLSACGVAALAGVTRPDVTRFVAGLSGRGFKPATVNKAVNSLSCFEHYLKETGRLPGSARLIEPRRDRVKVATGSEGEVSVFTEAQLNALLKLANDPARVGQRNRLVVHLLAYTGVRVSELVGVRLRDVDLVSASLTVRGKGGKLREVPLRAEIVDLVREYLKGERAAGRFADSEYLLVSQRAPRMHRDAVNALLERMGAELGFRVHPHQFRHTFCSMLVRRGVPLTTVAKLAGHAGVETTARFYVSTSRQDKARAVELL